jgi:hypothetical protein
MLSKLFTKLETVHLADSVAEREAIYRFRYTIYVEELGREIGGVDHEARTVRDDDDENPTSYHLYIGSLDHIVAAVRVQVWEPGEVPEQDFRISSMHLFPDIDSMVVGEMGRFMIRRTRRGRMTLPSMARGAYEFLVAQKKMDLAFLYCRPGLVNHYRRLGARPYKGAMVDMPEGIEAPMVMVASDLEYFKAMKSPLAPYVKKYFGRGPGKRTAMDFSRMAFLFDDDQLPVVTDNDAVWDEINAELLGIKSETPTFLTNIPEEVVRKLSDQGYIMTTPAGGILTREGHTEREMFLILEGLFDIVHGDTVVEQVGKGAIIGEVAFFREGGQRTATVIAATDGRTVTLQRKFIDELSRTDPRSANVLLFNLARILSERLAWSRI